MKNKITLNSNNPSFEEVSMKIIDMQNNEKGIKEVFKNKQKLLAAASYNLLIECDGKDIGFISLRSGKSSYPACSDRFYFVDMGLKEEYRNKGISKEVFNILREKMPNKYFIGETKKSNLFAINSGVVLDYESYKDTSLVLLGRYYEDEIAYFMYGLENGTTILDELEECFHYEKEVIENNGKRLIK